MKKWLKRIRGALGIGVTWAAVWGGVGAILTPFFSATVFVVALSFAQMGFIGGVIFSTLLGISEGRRRFDEMSLPRFAFWGALGGLLLSMLMFPSGAGFTLANVIGTGVVTLMGAGSAAGSLALARRADPLLESGEDVGLLEEESPDPST